MACEVSIDVVDQLLCSLQSSAVPTSLECVSSGLRGLFGLRSSIVGTWDLEFEAFVCGFQPVLGLADRSDESLRVLR